ncbi:uncharacterized protein TNCV_3252751 [Trichonephila clavipes]|nr:uncharacterized protein TNCV_3252751 [Trichonephila clavipes]
MGCEHEQKDREFNLLLEKGSFEKRLLGKRVSGLRQQKKKILSSHLVLKIFVLETWQETTRGLLATDHVILNHGQVTWTTPELAPPLLTTTPHQREDVSALDRFNVHRCPTRRVFSGTGLVLVTRQATIRYLYHSATADASGLREKVLSCLLIGRWKLVVSLG